MPVLILCMGIALCITSKEKWRCSNGKRFTNNLQIKAMGHLMLDLCRFNKDAREKQRIIILSCSERTCSLVLVRYDFRPCQTYFVKRCERKEVLRKYQRDGELILDYTNRLFDSFLKSSDLTILLQPSTLQQKRHKMANDAKCICWLVEEMLS
ncbi:hypothetical protein DPMN_004557 [Dreissena polymorpha]|uniref:Uncharacterized protein n=1 Tax=Dreissena polymorpha TaxID=45954 RepID=A0A9D4MNR4_DREPO|nr:hypothetical protein DPMN_004557 [Dreissena polymorpha]